MSRMWETALAPLKNGDWKGRHDRLIRVALCCFLELFVQQRLDDQRRPAFQEQRMQRIGTCYSQLLWRCEFLCLLEVAVQRAELRWAHDRRSRSGLHQYVDALLRRH